MSKKNNIFFYVLLVFFFSSSTQCIIIGSETAVSVQPLASFPASDTDNTMLGFGWFKNGFGLQDSTTTCTFNSVYPVSGSVDMGGGTLTLLQDLIFHNVTTLNGMGNIIGNNCALDFCTSVTALPSNQSTFKDTNIFLNSDLVITSSITLQGNCSFSGHGHSLILSTSGALIVDSNAQVAFQEMEIKGLQRSNLQCTDNTGAILLNDVAWEQNGDYTFINGSILFQDTVTFKGTATFYYSSNQTSTIDSNSTWCLTNGIRLHIGRDSITGNEPMAFTDSTSILKLSNCGYDIASTGIALTKGTIFFENYVDAHITSTSFATGVTMGTGNAADDFNVYFSPGCSVNHHGYMTYNNSKPDCFKSTSDTTLLVRQPNSHVLANTNFLVPKITVQLVSNSVAPISVSPGASLSFDETAIVLPSVSFDITGIQQSAFTYIMPGNGMLNFSRGSLPLYLIAQSTGNQILGNGSFDGPITLQNSSAALFFAISGYVGNALTLNNGTITLGSDLDLYNNGIIVGPGTVNLANRVLHINSGISSWTTPITWQAAGGGISLEQKLSLASTWTVQGTCILDGNNNELEFLSNGQIVIDSNSELYLKNMRLQSIANVNISCVDDTGKLVLDDVYWTQTDDYHFPKGSISFINEVDLVGSYTFFYESTQTSTIGIKSTLTARDHINLSIGKQQIGGAQEPLLLTDSSSLIVIDNAQWSITGDGMRLTKGRAICVDDVLIDIVSTNSGQGLKLGDTTQSGDMVFEFRPGTTVRMPRGHVVCDWFANNNVKSQSTTAQLIRNAANSFYCSSDIVLSNLTIVTEPGAPLVIASGKTFGYSNCVFDVPGGRYIFNGEFYNAYTNLLGGNDSLTLSRGALPLYSVINGTGNVIDGNGSVTGEIIYLSPAADLTWVVNGVFANILALNGGTLNLGVDMHLGNGALINGPGVVDISNYLLRFGAQNFTASDLLNINSSGGQLELNSDFSLASTWTITGNCTIQGNGNSIDLGVAGQIVIDAGSTLCLRDVTLKNVGNTNIRCLDDAGILILDDVIWSQPTYDYAFAKGAIIIRDNVLMTGDHVFAYQTQKTSTISAHSQLILDSDFTFSYDPNVVASQDLITFVDRTSQLVLNGATLHATGTGLNLLNGQVSVHGVSHVSSDTGAGITFGNSLLVNDCNLFIDDGSRLVVDAGTLNYKNLRLDSLILLNGLSELEFAQNTTLQLYQSIVYARGRVTFSSSTTQILSPGVQINGSVLMR